MYFEGFGVNMTLMAKPKKVTLVCPNCNFSQKCICIRGIRCVILESEEVDKTKFQDMFKLTKRLKKILLILRNWYSHWKEMFGFFA